MNDFFKDFYGNDPMKKGVSWKDVDPAKFDPTSGWMPEMRITKPELGKPTVHELFPKHQQQASAPAISPESPAHLGIMRWAPYYQSHVMARMTGDQATDDATHATFAAQAVEHLDNMARRHGVPHEAVKNHWIQNVLGGGKQGQNLWNQYYEPGWQGEQKAVKNVMGKSMMARLQAANLELMSALVKTQEAKGRQQACPSCGEIYTDSKEGYMFCPHCNHATDGSGMKKPTAEDIKTAKLGKSLPPGPGKGQTLEEHEKKTGIKNAKKTMPKEYKEGGADTKKEYADSANYKYPIDTPEHIRAAAAYFSKPKNYGMYSAQERATMWGRIRRAAAKAGVEISDKSAPGSESNKSFYMDDPTTKLTSRLRDLYQ